MSRQPCDAKKAYITRAGCLRKCKNPECMGVSKKGVLRRWPLVELSAYGSVHKQNFNCIKGLLAKISPTSFLPI